LDSGNLKEAFEAAHSLKGVTGNLSLTPLYEKLNSITEFLREEKQMDYAPLMAEINGLKDELVRICGEG
jgi:HPt (histidine-containing phosphotransfer) domain-containing protein